MHNKHFIIRYRWPIIAATLLLALASVIPLSQIRINPDLESYLPSSIAPKVNTDRIEEIFGDQEMIVLVFESDDVLNSHTLERIRNLSREFNKMDEFKQILSLFDTRSIKGDQGMMVVEPVIQSIPTHSSEREKLRQEIIGNDLAYGLVVSEDFHYTLIILNSAKNTDDASLMALIENQINAYPGDESVSINGQPYLRNEANNKIGRDILLLLPLGLVVMFIFLWISFKEKRGVLLPFSVVVISILIALGLIPLFGWELGIIGVLIPIMMIAIANNYGVYFITKYQELNATRPDITMPGIAVESFQYLKNPVLLCGLTTIAGILGLVVHILKPAGQMGVVSSIAIAFALMLSLFFIPAILSLMKRGKIQTGYSGNTKGVIDKTMNKLVYFSVRHPKKVMFAFSMFLLVSILGFLGFKTASDHNNILPEKHSYNQSLSILNDHFKGNKIISVLFEGDIMDPELLNNLDRYQSELEKSPGIGSVTSIASVIRKMSTALNNPGDPLYDRIPDSREAVAQYIELYNMSGDPDDFANLVDFDYMHALLTIQYQAANMKEINQVLSQIETVMRNDPHKKAMGGYSLIDREICRSVVSGQYYSLIFAFLMILLLLSLIFKSIVAGLMGSIPLFFAVLCTFGIMGWTGIELNIVTALLSSVSIGLGVDFTIQLFWKLKTEIARGKTLSASVKAAVKTMGRGITINAFSVMLGFSVLFFSSFPIIRSFAILIIVSLFFCLVSALLLIPAICMVIKPRFLGIKPKPSFRLEADFEIDNQINKRDKAITQTVITEKEFI